MLIFTTTLAIKENIVGKPENDVFLVDSEIMVDSTFCTFLIRLESRKLCDYCMHIMSCLRFKSVQWIREVQNCVHCNTM